MNPSEAKYSEVLEARRRAGEIIRWEFERVTLRLAPDLRYTPDFLVITADQEVQFHEFKGFWQDDARAKIKMAAAAFPEFVFFGVTKRREKDGGGYEFEEFQPFESVGGSEGG